MLVKAFFFAAAGVIASGALAWAQDTGSRQPTRPGQGDPTETRLRLSDDSQQTQQAPPAVQQAPGTPGAVQTQPGQPVQPRQAGQQAQQSDAQEQTVRRVSPEDRTSQGQHQKLDKQFAAMLALGNQMEIEMGKVALHKSQTPEVRRFAQVMIEDHGAHLKKLEQFGPSPSLSERSAEAVQRQQPDRETAQGEGVTPDLLKEIGIRAARLELAMTKQQLEPLEGQDFDMGFLSHQIVVHTQMLAALHALKQEGSPAFQEVVQSGITTTESHLQHARQLAGQLEDQEDQPTQQRAATPQGVNRPATPAANRRDQDQTQQNDAQTAPNP